MVKKRLFPRSNINNIPVLAFIEIPPVFFYPLVQGGGKEPELKVKVKQSVVAGEVLAEANSSSPLPQKIHTAVGGTVKSIRSFRYSGNYNSAKAVEIEFGGNLNTFSQEQDINLTTLDADKVLQDIANAGIFDLDIGSLNVKLEEVLQQKIDTIVLNALEVSPFMVLEEKILELHSKEIAKALVMLQQALRIKKDNQEAEILVISNYAKSRKSTLRHIYDILGKSKRAQAKRVSLLVDAQSIPGKNNLWLLQQLFEEKTSDALATEQLMNQTLVLRPSTLLAIYEAVFCGKPYVEKYIQIIVGDKKTFILKTFLGVPLFYLLTQTGEIVEKTNHFFIGDFMKRSVVFDFTTPVSKHFSHIFALTDESFSQMYTRLKPWHQATGQEVSK